MDDVRRVDPKDLIGREAGRIVHGVRGPNAVAVDAAGRLYVGGDSEVCVLAPDGTRDRAFAVAAPVTCLAIGADGSIFVGMRDRVDRYGADGQRQMSFPPFPGEPVLTSLAAISNRVFAADAGNRVIHRLDGDGNETARIGEKSTEFPGFLIPSPYFDIAGAPDGTLWAVDPGRYRFVRFSVDGAVLSVVGGVSGGLEGFCGCCNPSHFALRGDGSFVTSEKGVVRIKVHRTDGAFAGVVAAPDAFGASTRGLDVAVDGRGWILVLDPAGEVIRVYEAAVQGDVPVDGR
jgi:sugar lactone lactonase YvrE